VVRHLSRRSVLP